MKKLLITGASGFIGGFLVEKALERNFEVFVNLRKTSDRRYLQDNRINFLELSLNHQGDLVNELKTLKLEHGIFDYVIHNAGITKASRNSDFFQVNEGITKTLGDALMITQLVSKKFVFISSLAAAGPGNNDLDPINIDQEPCPVTAYGESKLAAERFLNSTKDFPYLILRPCAVFGPRDTELFTLFDLINKRLELYIGTDEQNLSFIYVKDLVDGILAAMGSKETGKTYFISDGKRYLIKEFVTAIKLAMNKKTIKIKVPVMLVSIVAYVQESIMGLFGKVPALNSEKMAELTSKNWVCDMEVFFSDVDFQPKYDLQTAVNETVAWYKKEKWI
ncbi:MAG: NAD(P)-dependent oxidoreductase [Bacteroidetes bacterium]|nr:NAD(P)-dependent oxidoreductase [Bacteroidota bacterium]MDA1119309.1 NAD(P)-dependent oxidoreductase [Bacteroidota bacterium]